MSRQWTIRARIITLLLAPMIPMLAVLIVASTFAIAPALNLRSVHTSVEEAGSPITALLQTLQNERELSVVQVSLPKPTKDSTADLAAARTATDAAERRIVALQSDDSFRGAASADTLSNLDILVQQVGLLSTERSGIDRGAARTDVLSFYSNLAEAAFDVYQSIASLDDAALQRSADQAVGLLHATEYLSRENAIVAGALAAGHESAEDYQGIVSTISTQRFLFTEASSAFAGPDLATFQAKVTESAAYLGLSKMENELIESPHIGGALPVKAGVWQSDYAATSTTIDIYEEALSTRVINDVGNAASGQERRLGIAIGIAAALMVILLLLSLQIARRLIRRLAGLRQEALMVAHLRLPEVVSRVRRGDQVDLAAETPPLRYGDDELGQLADAFTRVQDTAIGSAVHEASLRAGLSQVFLNIARRSQTLLHRQLALLDAMERRISDPDDLEELFRIDHLATRMRRHAEDLVVLAGSVPGRGWRTPVPLGDVLRAAASEVEEFARISVSAVPDAGLAGRAVNDVVHLVAELLENATTFSPPETQVLVSGRDGPDGSFLIEIEDRGLGMDAATMDEANQRLAQPPDFDPANSSRLGLFVVARLAARHNIGVTLRASDAGGVVAATLIPADLVVSSAALDAGAHSGAEGASTPRGRLGKRLPSPRPVAGQSPPAELPPVARPAPDELPPAARPAPDEEDTFALTADGLPKRGRQRSRPATHELPPGQHTAGADDAVLPGADRLPAPVSVRTPEEMRAMLASFQRSSLLGRQDATIRLAGAGDSPQEDAVSTEPSNGAGDVTAVAHGHVADASREEYPG